MFHFDPNDYLCPNHLKKNNFGISHTSASYVCNTKTSANTSSNTSSNTKVQATSA